MKYSYTSVALHEGKFLALKKQVKKRRTKQKNGREFTINAAFNEAVDLWLQRESVAKKPKSENMLVVPAKRPEAIT